MNSEALCSCGSGKQHKFCCGKAPATVSVKAAFTWFLIGILVCGIAALVWLMPNDNSNSTANPTASINPLQQQLGAPQHLQYDPITNKHYFAGAGHNHWHDGPPPSVATTNPLLSQPLANQPNLGSQPVPNIPNPQPWQYDPITNQHYVATLGHQHWHSGPPPSTTSTNTLGSGSTPVPNIPNPEPWQYDPITDQHYVPTIGHQHWHSGPPPSNPG